MPRKLSLSSRMFFTLSMRVLWMPIFAVCMAAISQAQEPVPSQPLTPRMILPRMREPLKPAQLTAMEVNARIVGLNAEVTATMTFFNPNKRALEGDLEFPLPANAGIAGYALDIQGEMVDGVVVKKEKARVAFETEVKKGVDPGLVEHVAGNVFRTRVFPLPANGARKVRVRYVMALPSDARGDVAWHLPMPVGEEIGKLSVRVEVSQGTVKPEMGGFGDLKFESMENLWVAKKEFTDVKPDGDLWVALPKLPPKVVAVEKAKDGVYFSVSDAALVGYGTEMDMAVPIPAHLGIAWDASGSRASGKSVENEIALLKKLLVRLPHTEVTLLVFRDKAEAPQVFKTGDMDALLKSLGDLPYDGGTDLSAAAEVMGKIEKIDQWLLFTDGLDTLSGRIPDFGKQKVSAIVDETVADRDLLEQLCAKSGGQVVDLQNLKDTAAVDTLMLPSVRIVAVHGDGVADLQGVGPAVHGRAMITGRLIADEATLVIEYSYGIKSQPIKLTKSGAGEGELLATVWAGARIRELSVRADDNEDQLLELGQKYGIVSPVTSLIVLETLDQYVQHEIRPPASLPKLRKQWDEQIEQTAHEKKKDRAEKLDQIAGLWKQRLQWWNTDFSKSRYNPGAKPKRDQDDAPESATDMQAPPPAGEMMPTATINGMGGLPAPAETRASVGSAGVGYGGGATADPVAASKKAEGGGNGADNALSITIKAWDPSTPYLNAIKKAGSDGRYAVYLEQRRKNNTSPAFFLDCADYFLKENDHDIGIRILTNLAEMKLEDPALLRVLAWRFEQAGELDRAIVVLRRVAKLRPEEAQSFRDLALALAERGKARPSPADLTEALALQQKVILEVWQRNDELELPALEEMNALLAWIKVQEWDKSPVIPKLDERLLKNMDEDVRIVLSWDADNTDVDLHVVEPTGEEVMYNHNRSATGGLVSHDVTQGYGPEEYVIRKARSGPYKIFAHYYGSTQQNVTGAVTVTATVFTHYGRPDEKKQVLTLRLDKVKDKVPIGKIDVAGSAGKVEAQKLDEQENTDDTSGGQTSAPAVNSPNTRTMPH